MTLERLKKLKISGSVKILKLRPDFMLRAAKTDSIGTNEHWSANHLCLLEDIVPRTVNTYIETCESFLTAC